MLLGHIFLYCPKKGGILNFNKDTCFSAKNTAPLHSNYIAGWSSW
jgi:hypothetical protein